MDGPRITTDGPDCKALLERQQAIIEQLRAQIAALQARLEKVERERQTPSRPLSQETQGRSEEAGTQERRGSRQAPSPKRS
jgi:transposase